MTQLSNFPRRGAWATVSGRTGIIAEITDKVAELHVVDDKTGETTQVVKDVPVESLAQATLAEIPKSRRPEPKHGARFGYK